MTARIYHNYISGAANNAVAYIQYHIRNRSRELLPTVYCTPGQQQSEMASLLTFRCLYFRINYTYTLGSGHITHTEVHILQSLEQTEVFRTKCHDNDPYLKIDPDYSVYSTLAAFL